MNRNRNVRHTYAGHEVHRHPLYPRLLLRRRLPIPTSGVITISGRLLLALPIGVSLFVIALVGSLYYGYTQIAAQLKPRLAMIENRKAFQTSRIFDRNGTLLYEFFDAGKRTHVAMSEISPLLIKATVAIEDKTFYTNTGVDFEGILRAGFSNLAAGGEVSGASTITQQVIKTIVLTEQEQLRENRYQRKLQEVILAQELNQRYTKDEILSLYLNEIFYGNLAYGIEAASQVYFKTSARDLSLPQAALLAGLPQRPSIYNPINFLQRDAHGSFLPGIILADTWRDPNYELPPDTPTPKWRQIAVLAQMVDIGYISEADARTAAAMDLRFTTQEVPLNAPHFVFYVRDLIQEKYGQQLLTGGGLQIYTTLDLDLERMAQQKAAERISELENRNIHNAAVVIMQPNTGQILAMVGSIDYNAVQTTKTRGEKGNVIDGQVNVTTRERQPGSSLKPFTYLAALEQGMTPATVIWDVPTKFPAGGGAWYEPKNYNGRFNGPVRIRTALANSLNVPAVKALKFAGVDYTLKLLDRVGVKTGLKRGEAFYGLALTLGGGEVTPLELTTAYNTLASNGRYYPPTPILRIIDGEGGILESFQPIRGTQVVSPELNATLTDMLSDDRARTAIWGLNSRLKLSQPAAVKTGTSNDWRDAWTLGFAPYVTVGVWSGNNNNEPTARVESIEGGGRIWNSIMEEIFAWIDTRPAYRKLFSAPYADGKLPINFTKPEDVGVLRRAMCELPGPFGGYKEEFFTPAMLKAATTVTKTLTTSAPTRQGIGCDLYEKFTVVRMPNAAQLSPTETLSATGLLSAVNFCLPVAGVTYPSDRLQQLTIWNIPPQDPSEQVNYRWNGGASGLRRDELQPCPAEVAQPAKPVPPVEGAILMPDLQRLGENQAKEVLARLGVTQIYVDYQGRERIATVFDQYLPYTVVSTLPLPNDWIMPGTTVVLGIRAPEAQPPTVPSVEPPPAPTQPLPELPPQPPPDVPVLPTYEPGQRP